MVAMMIDDDTMWRAVMARDGAFDGRFVYAVTSTGIYCRPSCSSRRPRRERVRFFTLPEAAAAGGFRACRRCRPDAVAAPDPATDMARRTCRAIADWPDTETGMPTLEQLGDAVGVSPHHLQRTFKKVLGLSPRAYADALRMGRFKDAVRGGDTVTGALYEAGFGSSSRLYERAAGHLGMTPASYARGGRGARIAFAVVPSDLGRVLVAATARGVCLVALGEDDGALESELRRDFPAAEIARDDGALAPWVRAVLDTLDGAPHPDLPLDVRATAFQARVWRQLLTIPRGETRTYGEIAAQLGQPGAARAVGRACATNPVSLVVPCHRAVGSDGRLTGYRWGVDRKQALLARERGGDG
ncbi:MAG: bifunctional DNA-binding transcriptional regulator/O6-methylguanine-DNA methyltransferase Ada [Hyphomicrobiales bacterium]|nr:bifunctional DNA-binding transcriptional regulator/O6-methylguanine-DNA methyltransferase Ada [Hyphomicrobiales bacterium]MCP5370197.1 bifunctional DNA-binding transcriptional regulator/O6-methylguanine-DNA methyltransferase Ada [Hyphomicrobiales bacterium]